MTGSPLRVLVVDDNPGDARLIEEALRGCGPPVRVAVADRVSAALARLEREGADVVLLDLGLPDGHDLEGLSSLRARRPEVPVIVMTGRNDATLAAAAVKGGAQDYIVKGLLPPGELERALRNAVERKGLEETLHKWEQIFLHAGWGAAVTDAEGGTIEAVNLAFAAMHGYEREELAGRGLADLLAPEAAVALPARLAETAEKGHRVNEELHRRKDGSAFPVLAQVTAFKDARGAVRYRSGCYMDLTEHKRAEALEALAKREAQQREFIANVSHDFRTPLAAIRGFTETLMRGAIGDKKVAREFVGGIERHVERLSLLIEDLLQLSTLGSPDHKIVVEPLPLDEFVPQGVAGLAPLARKKKLAVRVQVPPGLRVLGDKRSLDIVLQNLCHNAIEYSHAGGRIEVEVRRDGAAAVLCVRDQGIGIPAADLPNLFQRFHRTAEARRLKPHGTGLGLLIAKRLLDGMGASIRVESKPGKGSAFFVNLPLAAS